ncbi:phage portal protein, partial [Agrobacterium sp. S2]|nr:phage portal protein [Agrobacterium sp. S2]
MAWNWAWKRPGRETASRLPAPVNAGRELKMTNGFVALHVERNASWIARDYTT